MRLLETSTLKLVEFNPDEIPSYAILSHTWGKEEITLSEFHDQQARKKAGFRKITHFCAKAGEYGFSYGWVDTCCIDKSNSEELSEAINSMFNWYARAQICFAYLSDVATSTPGEWDNMDFVTSTFGRSRWFTRGWTLQELLASKNLTFMDQNWNEIGTKDKLVEALTTVTRIRPRHLVAPSSLDEVYSTATSIAEKMSWASERKTTRPEDIAYCLLGLFGVNMTLLYGEGGGRAFLRLQMTLIAVSADESIFAWSPAPDHTSFLGGLLAPSVASFRNCGGIQTYIFDTGREPYTMTNRGLRMEGFLIPCSMTQVGRYKRFLLPLNCTNGPPDWLQLNIYVLRYEDNFFVRPHQALSNPTSIFRPPLMKNNNLDRHVMYFAEGLLNPNPSASIHSLVSNALHLDIVSIGASRVSIQSITQHGEQSSAQVSS